MATAKGLFSPDLISAEVASSLPESYKIRPLEREDYHKGFFECIQVLTSTGDVSEEKFGERYDWMKNQGKGILYFLVIEHEGRIVGSGTLMVERKLYVTFLAHPDLNAFTKYSHSIHDLGNVAHIEEIAIRKEEQGKKLGLKMIQALGSVAKNVGCYKSILGSGLANEGFYKKCGYETRGLIMGQYYEEEKSDYERG